ncbi:MAG TPA: PKD domain-containing protein [Flavitalea sp.]|nr:PKD domain-containing protein [Flavitalea sp.]
MRLLTLAVAMLFAVCVNGQQVKKSIRASNGVQIGFYEFKPANYGKVSKQPLIIFLHGIGERGNGTSELQRVTHVGIPKLIAKGNPMTFTYKGKTESFLVLSPQLSKRYGTWQTFYVEELIEYAKKHLDIDPNRIFVTGLSLGGGGVWKFASSSNRNASQVAAILPICGTCAMSNPAAIKQADLKVWAFHAKDDRRVGVGCTIKSIERINNLHPKTQAKKTYFATGGHAIWDRVYNPTNKFDGMNVYQWFLSVRKSGSSNSNSSKDDRDESKPVAKANVAPTAVVADASIIIKYPKDRDVQLNGAASRDKDGKIVSYQWAKVSGPSARIAYAKMAKTNVSNLNPGTYKFRLTVTDNDGAKDQAYVTVRVTRGSTAAADKPKPAAPTRNLAPIALVSDASIVVKYPKETLTYLNASRSADKDGKIVSYLWTQIDGKRARIANSRSVRTAVSDLEPGVYRFQLTVTDNDGATNSTIVRLTVVNVNKAPAAIVSDASVTVKYPDVLMLNGSQSKDPDGRIEHYRWTQVEGRNAHISYTKMPKTRVSGLVPGIYKFQLTVTDNYGASDNAYVTVRVVR